MTPSSVASLLVAALALLGRPCPRNTAVARLLLQRASSDAALSSVERETCREIAETLDTGLDLYTPAQPPGQPKRSITDRGLERRHYLSRLPAGRVRWGTNV
ncbi:MAG: hypothetical protein MUE59_00385 [Thiobacillaceae bacterium]|jgi:hypothetical protein|nr:hypothetical protein [Thiobacillaceae bacterium]